MLLYLLPLSQDFIKHSYCLNTVHSSWNQQNKTNPLKQLNTKLNDHEIRPEWLELLTWDQRDCGSHHRTERSWTRAHINRFLWFHLSNPTVLPSDCLTASQLQLSHSQPAKDLLTTSIIIFLWGKNNTNEPLTLGVVNRLCPLMMSQDTPCCVYTDSGVRCKRERKR